MKLFRFALLLLVQLSPILVHGNGEADYECKGALNEDQTVTSTNAKLINGCVLNGKGITFDIGAMYKAAARKTPQPTAVVIDITDADFINSYIKLINAEGIPSDINTQVPLLFTMSNSNMKGTSKLEFGEKGEKGKDKLFKLPPRSTLRIIDSHLTISSTAKYTDVIAFHSLQLVTGSSIEITDNVITMECKGCVEVAIFFISKYSKMEISDKSSVTLQGNQITMKGDYEQNEEDSYQSVLYGSEGSFTISDSEYTWASNIIKMEGDNVGNMYQSVWFQKFDLTISQRSKYTWESNTISMIAHHVANKLYQYVWNNGNIAQISAPLTISASAFTWLSNTISMKGYDLRNKGIGLFQCVWMSERKSDIKISGKGTYTWESNTINMVGYGVTIIDQYVSSLISPLTISEASHYNWKSNTITIYVHDIAKDVHQTVWLTHESITLTSGQFLFETNKILMTAKDYGTIESYVMMLKDTSSGGLPKGTISGGSSMVWKGNCVGMGHKKTGKSPEDLQALIDEEIITSVSDILDKRHMFAGKWSITGAGSQLLYEGNYITTTDKYGASSGDVTALVLDPTEDTAFTIASGGKLTIGQTQVYSNSVTDSVTDKRLWRSTSLTSNNNVANPDIKWTSSAAKLKSGLAIPTLDIDNLKNYICVPLTEIPSTDIDTPEPTPDPAPENVDPHTDDSSPDVIDKTPVEIPVDGDSDGESPNVIKGAPNDAEKERDDSTTSVEIPVAPVNHQPPERKTADPAPEVSVEEHHLVTPPAKAHTDGKSPEHVDADKVSPPAEVPAVEPPVIPGPSDNTDVIPQQQNTPQQPSQREPHVNTGGSDSSTSGSSHVSVGSDIEKSIEEQKQAKEEPKVQDGGAATQAGLDTQTQVKGSGDADGKTSGHSKQVPTDVITTQVEAPKTIPEKDTVITSVQVPKGSTQIPTEEKPKISGSGPEENNADDTDKKTGVYGGDKNAQETSGDNVKKEVQKAAEPEKDKPKGTETNKKHVTTIVREDTDKKTVVSEGGTSPEAKPGVPKADASPKTSTDKDSKPDTVAKGPPKVSVIVPPMSDVNKTTILSATAISSTIPAVLITSVVFLYLYK